MLFMFFKIEYYIILRILYSDSTSGYNQLLNKANKTSMEVKCPRNLALEIFKTLNHLKPECMEEIFYKTSNLTHSPFNIKVNLNHNIMVNHNNTTKNGKKSLKSLELISWIPCQSRLMKKPTTISLKILLINRSVQNVNAACNYIQHDPGFDPLSSETVLSFYVMFYFVNLWTFSLLSENK